MLDKPNQSRVIRNWFSANQELHNVIQVAWNIANITVIIQRKFPTRQINIQVICWPVRASQGKIFKSYMPPFQHWNWQNKNIVNLSMHLHRLNKLGKTEKGFVTYFQDLEEAGGLQGKQFRHYYTATNLKSFHQNSRFNLCVLNTLYTSDVSSESFRSDREKYF